MARERKKPTTKQLGGQMEQVMYQITMVSEMVQGALRELTAVSTIVGADLKARGLMERVFCPACGHGVDIPNIEGLESEYNVCAACEAPMHPTEEE